MSEQTEKVTKITHIRAEFAQSENDLYQNKPFFGTVFKVFQNQKVYFQHIGESERLTLSKWLSDKNITEGSFLLETKTADDEIKTIYFNVDKTGEGKAFNPFLSGLSANQPNQSASNGLSQILKQEYEAQILRLSNALQEADREKRKLMDELMDAKRELSQDNTERLLTQREEVNRLEKEKDKEIAELKGKIKDLEFEQRISAIEYKNTDRSVGNRFLDFMEEKGGDFLAQLLQQIQAANPNKPITSEMVTQELKDHQQLEAVNPENHNPKAAQIMADNIELLKNKFIEVAVNALTKEDTDLQQYAHWVRTQMQIAKSQGVELDTHAWVQMAKILAEKSVRDGILPARLAAIIEPVLEPLKPQMGMMSMLPSSQLVNMLFSGFKIEADETVKELVAKVLDELKKRDKQAV